MDVDRAADQAIMLLTQAGLLRCDKALFYLTEKARTLLTSNYRLLIQQDPEHKKGDPLLGACVLTITKTMQPVKHETLTVMSQALYGVAKAFHFEAS